MAFLSGVFFDLSSSRGLSHTELMAMSLDGEVAFVADGFTFADIPACASIKAQIVTLSNVVRYAPIGESALWVYGLTSAPQIHSVALIGGIRANHETLNRRRVRELAHIEHQLDAVGIAQVQSPKWALIELAKDPVLPKHLKKQVMRQVCTDNHALCVEAGEELERQRKRPHAVIAMRALALTHAVDVVDGIDPADSIENTLEVNRVAHLEHETAER